MHIVQRWKADRSYYWLALNMTSQTLVDRRGSFVKEKFEKRSAMKWPWRNEMLTQPISRRHEIFQGRKCNIQAYDRAVAKKLKVAANLSFGDMVFRISCVSFFNERCYKIK